MPVAPHCRTKIQGAWLDPHLGGGDGRFRVDMGGFRDQGVETGRAGPEYLIIRLLGWHSIFNFEIRISVFFCFFLHLASPAIRF